MDVRSSLAVQGYAATRPAVGASGTGAGQDGPGKALTDAARGFAATLAEGERVAKAAMTGQADPHALVQALAESQLAVETAVTVRDRVVEAYQEILRMQV